MNKETNSLFRKENSRGFPIILAAIIIILALGAGSFLLFKDTEAPTITTGPNLTDVNKKDRKSVV